jgi:sulfur carrier protein ThiS
MVTAQRGPAARRARRQGDTVRIDVKLIGLTPRTTPAPAAAGWYGLSISETVRAGDLAGLFGLDNDTLIVIRDKKPCPPDALLREGDRILLLTMAEGG